MRSRVTSLLTTAALVCGALSVPAAQAADVSARESAHGQWLCSISASESDRALARDVRAGYIATIKATSEQIQAQFPKLDFSAYTSRDISKAPGYAATVAALSKAGYTGADMLIIMVGASAPEELVADESVLLPEDAEYSINAAAARAEKGPAPLLSTGSDFSPKLRAALAENQAQEKEAVDAFNAAQSQSFAECVEELRGRGAQEGIQPVPELPIPGQTTQQQTSSTGAAVLGVMTVLTVLVIGGYLASNGASFGGFELPVLRLPGMA
ncbi:serine/threonine protein kinase [Corynebacterium aurimucosum]|uniref:serine/threonine protein kinase n=1 Tax=Corynebacterium aurimucosum TaxID=169292 RepID=UPI000C8021B8|nr:serine/threonine protein kinase [Corynebacterium aurimucosum]PMC72259.1 serine/threonine protein kinase [Corynebacterium aurimucosum]